MGPRLTAAEAQAVNSLAGIALDATSRAARWAALIVGVLLIGANFSLPERRPGRPRSDRATPEFFMLLLFSLAGLMLTGMANDLIVLFLALELASVPTFIAVALSRPQHGATEAAGKYFFLGALSLALLVMGLAYLFGATGQTNLNQMHARLLIQPAVPGYVLLIGMGLVVAGLAFKIAAFPYHVYIADVYEGSAAPVAGWLSFVPKAAGFLALARLLTVIGGPAGLHDLESGAVLLSGWVAHPVWGWLIWGLAVATMTAGNVLALWQRNVKRLLAYSSVAHSGYLLVALLLVPETSARQVATPLLFYLVVYGIANLGAFLVLSAVRSADPAGGTREAETFADLHGLGRRRPAMAIGMAVFVFALMGLPPTAGFLAKAYVFIGAFRTGYDWLVVIALLNAAVGAAYYLRIVGACWIGGAEEEAPGEHGQTGLAAGQSDSGDAGSGRSADRAAPPLDEAGQQPPGLVIAICAFVTLLFGVAPGQLQQWFTKDLVLNIGRNRPPARQQAEPADAPQQPPAPRPLDQGPD